MFMGDSRPEVAAKNQHGLPYFLLNPGLLKQGTSSLTQGELGNQREQGQKKHFLLLPIAWAQYLGFGENR